MDRKSGDSEGREVRFEEETGLTAEMLADVWRVELGLGKD